jgi:hypothetical protein
VISQGCGKEFLAALYEVSGFGGGTEVPIELRTRRDMLHFMQSPVIVRYGELLLSKDEEPKNAVVVASVPEGTGPDEWDKFPEQKSKVVKLEAGKEYSIEARMKEGVP